MSFDDSGNKISRYQKIEFLGEGQVCVFNHKYFCPNEEPQFATVYKARDLETDEIVAVKKIKLGSRIEAKDGINRTALREIKILQELSHPHVIGLKDVFGHRSNVSLVFDFMETDLEVIIRESRLVLSSANIKAYMIMTLKGLNYLHDNWILHRDLKPNNLLVDKSGIVKLADFGLAKSFGSPNRIYTHQVVTRWYRAPELLFGARKYGVGVDLWAIGCILAELLLRKALLPGETDLDQLSKIFQVMGTPDEQTWPGVSKLPDFVSFKPQVGCPLSDIFTAADNDLIDVLTKLLSLDPLKRGDCLTVLKMCYFKNKPYPTAPALLPRPSLLVSTSSTKRGAGDNSHSHIKAKRLHFE